MVRKLLIRNTQSPGDVVVLSAMIRDLHKCYPGLFETAVTTAPGAEHVFFENSHVKIATAKNKMIGYKPFVAHYPLINSCNQQRKHFLWGFIEDINARMHLHIKLTEFKPDLHLSTEEKANPPYEQPYWVFLSGGKGDFKTKLWYQQYWQDVIDKTAGRINWVQCGGGSKNHIQHIKKNGVLAAPIGQTVLREFIRIIYHAEGVACVITAAMHIAAAFNKPCVVIAGGREPWWWEAYTKENRLVNMRFGDPTWEPPVDDTFIEHKFLHTIGQLSCCQTAGCWKKKVTDPGSRCTKPVSKYGETIPACKAMITPDMVVAAIEEYFQDGIITRANVITAPHTDQQVGYYIYAKDANPIWLKSIQQELPEAILLNGDTTREQGLAAAKTTNNDWIVWMENGVKLQPGWKRALQIGLSVPGVIGHIYRTSDGKFYPDHNFFAVHKTYLQPAATFVDCFKDIPTSALRKVGTYIQVPTY